MRDGWDYGCTNVPGVGWMHFYAASARYLGYLMSACPCGAKRFLGGYPDERRNRIAERLNRSWRVHTEARP